MLKLIFCLFSIILLNWKMVLAAPSVYPTGVTVYDPVKAYEHYTIFLAIPTHEIYLIDMEGNILHTWGDFPDTYRAKYAEPLNNGNLLVGLGNDDDTAWRVVEVDLNCNIVWQYQIQEGYLNLHEMERLDNGNTLILCTDFRVVPEISPKEICDDFIIEVNPQGQRVWQWYTHEHFDEFGFSQESKDLIAEAGDDWGHCNSFQSLPPNALKDDRFKEGNILMSQRNTNIIYIIDKETGSITWKIGPDDNLTIGQHMVRMVQSGRPGQGEITVFDNGGYGGYPLQARVFSRILQIDPLSKDVTWIYNTKQSEMELTTFFNPFMGGQQRLPNGNTLIVETLNGRFFQVTEEGEIVWEYINPIFTVVSEHEPWRHNKVYRIQAVSTDWLGN